MKVLLFIDALNSGGAERQLSYLAAQFKVNGFETKFITFYKPTYYLDYLQDYNITPECYSNGRLWYKRPFVIKKIILEYNPDLVIAYKDGATIGCCLAKLLTSFKLAVSERNTTQKITIREFIKFQLYRLADYIIPNSYSQARFISSHFNFLNNKVKVITNMVDTDKFKPGNSSDKDRTSINIVTTARVMPQKNVLTYLKAVKIITDHKQNIHFDWYGNYSSDSEYWLKVQKLISELKLENYVTFRGARTDIEKVYQAADIFCLPSIYEGFPNVITEAMASGLPIACSNVCDNPDIVNEPQNGVLFNPNDENDIANKLLLLINNSPEKLQSIGIGNRIKVLDLCSNNSFIKKYQSLV